MLIQSYKIRPVDPLLFSSNFSPNFTQSRCQNYVTPHAPRLGTGLGVDIFPGLTSIFLSLGGSNWGRDKEGVERSTNQSIVLQSRAAVSHPEPSLRFILQFQSPPVSIRPVISRTWIALCSPQFPPVPHGSSSPSPSAWLAS
ncbi:hypothetical protein ElyMa_002154100 [Elysia marginata]|uniref:Uncharacterized protein n=1 Tax=Elysia marginata TaxID=1093978 RepID=A0AAV4FKZ4_9GAST|nr:hypothetical protein ElyMa_002154100 [Elysia marginata]